MNRFFLGLVALAAAIYFFGDSDLSFERKWKVSCEGREVQACRLHYEAPLKDRADLRINIAMVADAHMFALSANGGSCEDKPWTFKVDSHPRESFDPMGVGALGALLEPYMADNLISQMQAGEKAIVTLSRPPACEIEAVTVDLGSFASGYKQLLQVMNAMEDGKINPDKLG